MGYSALGHSKQILRARRGQRTGNGDVKSSQVKSSHSSQVKASQVKSSHSSQVKSSQVKSSQVKSSAEGGAQGMEKLLPKLPSTWNSEMINSSLVKPGQVRSRLVELSLV